MSDEFSDLDEMLGFLSEEGSGPDGEEHLEPALIAAYQANELSSDDDLKVRTHLATCKPCRELLLDLEEMLAPSPPETVADFGAKAGWRKLQEELRRPENAPAPPLQVKLPEPGQRLLRSLRIYQALAATLGALTVGMTLYLVSHRSGLEILAPTEESAYFATTRGTHTVEKPLAIRLPCALPYSTSTEYPDYRIEIAAGDAAPSYSLETRLSMGVIPLGTGSLKSGAYKLRLLGLKDGHSELIGDPRAIIVEP